MRTRQEQKLDGRARLPAANDTRLMRRVLAAEMTFAQLAEALGVTTQTAWRYCLPRAHTGHVRPGEKPAEKLRAWSGGSITILNYADPVDTPAKHRKSSRKERK